MDQPGAVGLAGDGFVGWLAFVEALVPWLMGLWVLYWLATLPWRRMERARVFLEVLELGCRAGRSPEETLVEASRTRDRALPVRLHLVAAHIEQGMRLDQALAEVPYLLPPEVQALLVAGLRRNPLSAVLPLARDQVARRPDAGAGGLVAVGALLLLPGSTAAVFLLIHTVVFPKLRQVFVDLAGGELPALTTWVMEWGWALAVGLLVLKAAVYLLVFSRTAGPRLGAGLPMDALTLLIPWRRRRLHRQFAQVLAMNLDLGVPEAESVTSAAEATGNRLWRMRAQTVGALLGQGVALDQALEGMERAGEFHWRLRLGLRQRERVAAALRGWLEGLELRARRDEAMAAQAFFCTVILSNAALVGLTAVAIFGCLTGTLERMTLW